MPVRLSHAPPADTCIPSLPSVNELLQRRKLPLQVSVRPGPCNACGRPLLGRQVEGTELRGRKRMSCLLLRHCSDTKPGPRGRQTSWHDLHSRLVAGAGTPAQLTCVDWFFHADPALSGMRAPASRTEEPNASPARRLPEGATPTLWPPVDARDADAGLQGAA